MNIDSPQETIKGIFTRSVLVAIHEDDLGEMISAVRSHVLATEMEVGWRSLEPGRDPIQVSDEIYNRGWETMPHGIAGRLCSTLDMPMRRKCRFLKEPEEFHQPDERVTPKGDGGASSATHYASQSKSNKRDMGSPAGEPPSKCGATPRTDKAENPFRLREEPCIVDASFARQLERELSVTQKALDKLAIGCGFLACDDTEQLVDTIIKKMWRLTMERDELLRSRDDWKTRGESFDRQGYDVARERDLHKQRADNLEQFSTNLGLQNDALKSQLAEKQRELEAANTAFDQELSELRTLALKTSPWIPCSERLPERKDCRLEGYILVRNALNKHHLLTPAQVHVTDYWMPIPPLPPIQSVDEEFEIQAGAALGAYEGTTGTQFQKMKAALLAARAHMAVRRRTGSNASVQTTANLKQ